MHPHQGQMVVFPMPLLHGGQPLLIPRDFQGNLKVPIPKTFIPEEKRDANVQQIVFKEMNPTSTLQSNPQNMDPTPMEIDSEVPNTEDHEMMESTPETENLNIISPERTEDTGNSTTDLEISESSNQEPLAEPNNDFIEPSSEVFTPAPAAISTHTSMENIDSEQSQTEPPISAENQPDKTKTQMIDAVEENSQYQDVNPQSSRPHQLEVEESSVREDGEVPTPVESEERNMEINSDNGITKAENSGL
jgi:hypothetical protein